MVRLCRWLLLATRSEMDGPERFEPRLRSVLRRMSRLKVRHLRRLFGALRLNVRHKEEYLDGSEEREKLLRLFDLRRWLREQVGRHGAAGDPPTGIHRAP